MDKSRMLNVMRLRTDDDRDLCDMPVTSIGFSIIKNFIIPALHGSTIVRAKQVFRTLPVWGRELFSDIHVRDERGWPFNIHILKRL